MAELKLGEKTINLPIITGTQNEKGIDISKLRSETGYITLDPGYVNTGSCSSEITFIDGEKGILSHRGHRIEEITENSTFTELSYLLIYGKLPTQTELNAFEQRMEKYNSLPEGITKLIRNFPKTAHPMGVISSSIAGLSAYNDELLAVDLTEDQKDEVIAQIMAQTKLIAGTFYRHSLSEVDPVVVKAMDVLMMLHADHEQNCSASTVRMVGSSKANAYASIASGVNALWGSWHGGANQRVIEMLEEIQAEGGDYKKTLELVKEKKFLLFGFGHRVYKNFDPRAKIIKKFCNEILDELGVQDPILDLARNLEEAALNDDYFAQRKLYPNVDFYSGIIYKALGLPYNMFTPMFVLGRVPGWLAQWREHVGNPKAKISRPRQIYTGVAEASYSSIENR